MAKAPASTDGHHKLAQRLTGEDQIRELRIVLEQEPDQIDARLDLARALRRSGKRDEAIVQTRNAFEPRGPATRDPARRRLSPRCKSSPRFSHIAAACRPIF